MIEEEAISVVVRIRPQFPFLSESCLHVNKNSVCVLKGSNHVSSSHINSTFEYDKVFQASSQEDIFQSTLPLIRSGLNGFNVNIFAFGMTGSGKTHTIAGTLKSEGIIPRTVKHIFADLQEKTKVLPSVLKFLFLFQIIFLIIQELTYF